MSIHLKATNLLGKYDAKPAVVPLSTLRRRQAPAASGHKGQVRSSASRPGNTRWPHRGAQRPSIVIGQGETPEENTAIAGDPNHVGWHAVKPYLGTAEHSEAARRIHYTPSEIHKPFPR
jgi:hypothetical protein